ncbi:hypothetical protein SPRG_20662 [Saprolegnia parasitica CBS 223.65]|uniref:Microsomal glutathione S-transferase 1 n=1 Tax=Saprolegnia parasitica (strain CBS 223.65) TaxID=695850 RepID=A0A067C428_SAPPC|nr:hypothetical protein SPRG_20662 [Saprolegnia parasitica CBS 223.65]KDO25539.1 hypothetical protein SPRG_20662 [Saprolegnia parasitica CBS 223.65]|eukprot:XP_012203768.1 hypothetical protein SPRG_20662 [Saprolegnia parasitica CBS 223.65]
MLGASKAWVASSVVLYTKCLLTTAIQGGKRFAAGSRPPEDKIFKQFNPTKQAQTFGVDTAAATTAAREQDIRWERIVRNDLENIPIGLIVAWGAVQSGGVEAVTTCALGTFTAARVYHTYAYAQGLQPHRGNAWMVGTAAVLVMALNSLYGLATATPPTDKAVK